VMRTTDVPTISQKSGGGAQLKQPFDSNKRRYDEYLLCNGKIDDLPQGNPYGSYQYFFSPASVVVDLFIRQCASYRLGSNSYSTLK
jgi:hypothetical protein